MADITWDDVTAIAPALTTVPSDGQTLILAYANTELDVNVFGGESAVKTKLARVYLAAHLGTLSRPGASTTAAGPVISESVGAMSRSYANLVGAATGDALQRTVFGSMLAFLIATAPGARAPRVA